MEIVFVILHYMTDSDTAICINSIKDRLDTDSYHIIVVDNASNNGSIERITEKYKNDKKVSIILNKQNLGFARGLNVGIKSALEQFDPEYIVATNNDILLLSRNMCEVLNTKKNVIDYSVAGPMMITRDGRCSVNPIRNTIRSREEAQRLIKKDNTLYALSCCHLLWVYELQRKMRKAGNRYIDPQKYINDQIDYQLHGAFWIFSRRFFDIFQGLDEGIFLYGEESLLYLHLMKNNMHTLYTPDIQVFHKEDSSTETIHTNSIEKTKFVCKTGRKSLEYYIRVFDSYKNRN